MKKLLLSIATLAVAVGCSDIYTEDVLPVIEETQSEAQTTFVSLNLSLEGEGETETRVLVTEGESESDPWTVAWEIGDVVHVYSFEQDAYKSLTYDGTSFSGDVYLGENRVYYNNRSTYLEVGDVWWDDSRPYVSVSYSTANAKPYMVSSDVITIEENDDNDDSIVSSELEIKMKHLSAMIDFGMMFTGISSDLNLTIDYINIGGIPDGGSADEYTTLPLSLYTDPTKRYDDTDFNIIEDNASYGAICTYPYTFNKCTNDTEFSNIFGVRPFTLESGKKLSVTIEFNDGLFVKEFEITNDTGADFEFARATHSYLKKKYDLSDLSTENMWIFDAVPFADQTSTGTEDDPIEIASEEELAYLAAIPKYMTDDDSLKDKYFTSAGSEYYFKLTADLDLSGKEWTPIGVSTNYGNYFNFDGGGHTITGLTIEQKSSFRGLFTNICGTVKDLNLENVNITGTYNVGGLAGTASSDTAIITNCTVSGTVTGESYVGGLIGSSSWCSALTNCGSSCSVTATEDYAGGIAGSVYGTILTGCYNTGAVNCAGYGGGVTGRMPAGGNIFDCYNTGDVTTEDRFAGGITSHFIANYGTTSYITNCYNTGTITSKDINDYDYSNTAGIASNISNTVCIINCYNTGAITGYKNVAGIVASSWSSIIACYNVGELSSTSGTVGGITTTTSNSSISGCYFIAEDSTGYIGYGTEVTSVAELNAAVSSMNTAAADFDTSGTVVIKPYTAGSNNYTLPYLGIGGGEPFTYGDAGSSDGGSIEDLGSGGGIGSYE